MFPFPPRKKKEPRRSKPLFNRLVNGLVLLFIAYALLSALQREGSALRREVDLSKRSAQRAIPEDPFGSLPPKEMLRFGPAPATEEPPHSVPKKLPDKPEESVKSKKESK